MKLSVVTTMYHSESYLEEFTRRIRESVGTLVDEMELIFVNDGSPDASLDIARRFLDLPIAVTVLDLSRNYGHHHAIMIGLGAATGELVFLIDCDLEEVPEMFPEMLGVMRATSSDVVYAVPPRRKGGVFERVSGDLFYRLFNALSDVSVPRNWMVARLMTRRYVTALVAHGERELFLGGVMCLAGFKQTGIVAEKHGKRTSTYTMRRKVTTAVNALTSFSHTPLMGIFLLGSFVSVIAVVAAVALVINIIFFNAEYLAGWASTIVVVCIFGGMTLASIGIVGVYLGRVFTEVKARPYVIRDVYSNRAAMSDGEATPRRQAVVLP